MVSSWRTELPVLVPEAHAVGMIGVIRSLGRAGYPVHAMAQRADALGFSSAYAYTHEICPNYQSDSFIPWLREYIKMHGIKAIIPSDGLMVALRSCIDEFLGYFPIKQNARLLYSCLSKYDLFSCLIGDGSPSPRQHLAPSLLFDKDNLVSANCSLESLQPPYFVKGDACYSVVDDQSIVVTARTRDELSEVRNRISRDYSRYVVQGFVPGSDVGTYFLLWNGQLLGRFMNVSNHSVPHSGGFYSLRESVCHDSLMKDALEKLAFLGWEGAAMMEYRWDRDSGKFWLVEMNARFWGSLNHALYAGIDFPTLLLDSFFGRSPNPVLEYPTKLRCRFTFPMEVGYVSSVLKDPSLSFRRKLWIVMEFILLFFDFRIYADLFFPGDRKLYWISVSRTLCSMFHRSA